MEITLKELKCAHVKLKALLPRSQTVLGFLWQTLKSSQSDPVKIFVNQWPDFSVVVCKPLCQQEGDSFKDILVFAKDEVRLEEIRNNVLFDWSKYFCIGTNLDNRKTFSAVASEKHISCRYLAVCNMLILRDMSHLPDVNCAGITLGSLDESHIEMVNGTWKFGQKGSLRMIQNMVRNFPSCCVLDEGGRPVSWVLTYASSAMGMLYTTPEHRGKGYAKVVVSALAKRLFTEGYPVYCFIEEENTVSHQLFKRLGFTVEPLCKEAWFDFTPNTGAFT